MMSATQKAACSSTLRQSSHLVRLQDSGSCSATPSPQRPSSPDKKGNKTTHTPQSLTGHKRSPTAYAVAPLNGLTVLPWLSPRTSVRFRLWHSLNPTGRPVSCLLLDTCHLFLFFKNHARRASAITIRPARRAGRNAPTRATTRQQAKLATIIKGEDITRTSSFAYIVTIGRM